MLKRVVVVMVLLTAFVTGAFSGPAAPKVYFTAKRPSATVPGLYTNVTSSNGQVRVFPANGDTTGRGEDLAYIGGALYQWVFMPDSTDTYKFFEVNGDPDSLITGMDALALMGAELIVADSAVTRLALRPDADGVFRPSMMMEFAEDETLFVGVIAPCDTCPDVKIVDFHVVSVAADTVKATYIRAHTGNVVTALDSLLAAVWLYAPLAELDEIDMNGGSILEINLADGDSAAFNKLRALKGIFPDSVRIGTAGVSATHKIYGTISNTSGTINTGAINATGNVQLGDAAADSAKVYGDMRVRGGDAVVGTAGVQGKVGIGDGSSNYATITGAPMSADVTVYAPTFTIQGRLVNPQYIASGKYAYSFYIAGVDSSWAAKAERSGLYDPGGAGEAEEFPGGATTVTVTRPYFAYCKTDTVRVLAHSCCAPDDAGAIIEIFVSKHNMFRRAL